MSTLHLQRTKPKVSYSEHQHALHCEADVYTCEHNLYEHVRHVYQYASIYPAIFCYILLLAEDVDEQRAIDNVAVAGEVSATGKQAKKKQSKLAQKDDRKKQQVTESSPKK